MPWIERAEKALDMLAEHNKRSQEPSNEPIMRVKLQIIKANVYATNGQKKMAQEAYDKVMASPYAGFTPSSFVSKSMPTRSDL